MSVSQEAKDFNWLLVKFVQETDGVLEAVAVSADGILLASSAGRDRVGVEQFAAIASGLTSLTNGAAACFEFESVDQIVVEMKGGFLVVSAINDRATLAITAERNCDIGLVGYELTLLLDRVGKALTPALMVELKNVLTV